MSCSSTTRRLADYLDDNLPFFQRLRFQLHLDTCNHCRLELGKARFSRGPEALRAETVFVPPGLRAWFIIHFWVDLTFALPLFLAPVWFLGLLGWTQIDTSAARLVAAALFGIGIQSRLVRDEGVDSFRAMLNLKIIWSGAATLGLVMSQLEGAPLLGWALVAIFGAFNLLWVCYRVLLGLRSLAPAK